MIFKIFKIIVKIILGCRNYPDYGEVVLIGIWSIFDSGKQL